VSVRNEADTHRLHSCRLRVRSWNSPRRFRASGCGGPPQIPGAARCWNIRAC
jgi:hypothetical protein